MSMFNKVTKTFQWGQHTVTLETGEIARQSSGAVIVSIEDTMILATVVGAKNAKPGQDFFPLTVDYIEKTYAAGRIPGGYFKREGRPTEKEVLSSRLSDRPIRPLFSKQFPYETQIMATVMSSDQEHDADVLALIGASTAINLSDIPFPEPIGGVRVGRVDGEFVIMPTFEQLDQSDMDIIVAGTAENIIMVEGGTREISEADLISALDFAMEHIRKIVALQRDLVGRAGKPKRPLVAAIDTTELKRALDQTARQYSFNLRGENKRTRLIVVAGFVEVVKRLDADVVPGERQGPIPVVPHREMKHAVEMRQTFLTPLNKSCQQDLSVRCCPEHVALVLELLA